MQTRTGETKNDKQWGFLHGDLSLGRDSYTGSPSETMKIKKEERAPNCPCLGDPAPPVLLLETWKPGAQASTKAAPATMPADFQSIMRATAKAILSNPEKVPTPL